MAKKKKGDTKWIDDFPARKMSPDAFEGKTFRSVFREYSERFMDAESIAKSLLLTKNELDQRCLATFGMKSTEACNFYRTNADKEVRDALWELMLTGNTTATKIYSEYVSGIAREKAEQSGGIKVVVSIPKEDVEDD